LAPFPCPELPQPIVRHCDRLPWAATDSNPNRPGKASPLAPISGVLQQRENGSAVPGLTASIRAGLTLGVGANRGEELYRPEASDSGYRNEFKIFFNRAMNLFRAGL
jgi:hypothetical protein